MNFQGRSRDAGIEDGHADSWVGQKGWDELGDWG